MTFKRSFLIMVLFALAGWLMPISASSFENRESNESVSSSKYALFASDQPEEQISLYSLYEDRSTLRAWDDTGSQDPLESSGGNEGSDFFNDGPIADGVLILILLALFYGVIVQHKNKLKTQIN